MFQAEFHDNRYFGSDEEDIAEGFYHIIYVCVVAILIM